MNRINLIGLGVKDLKKSLAFYKGIGFKTPENDENPAVVFFDNQGTKLELCPLDKLVEDINPNSPPEIAQGKFPGVTFAINLKSEQEVDEFMELVVKNNGTVAKKPQLVFWGGYSGYFQDPDGYYWEVAYSKDWQFDENNMLIINHSQA
ncbi:MAG: VOC family protein [Treponema sp.]|jgi:predicted lactoylglutathione lyase|nr:VOC family protein [Treponema sp.]